MFLARKKSPIIIVGGGIIGLSVAYELLRRGRTVHVLEKDKVGAGASSVAAGMLTPACEADGAPQDVISFAYDSMRRYSEFVRNLEHRTGLSCGLSTHGTLMVATNADDEAEQARHAVLLAAHGISCSLLDGPSILAMEPHISSRVVGGLYLPHDLHIDPRRLLHHLTCAITQQGGVITEKMTVTEIFPDTRGMCVLARRADGHTERLDAEQVVLAAGAYASHNLTAQVAGLNVMPVKGQILRLKGPQLLRHVIRTPEVYLIPRDNGELMVGATMEDQGFDVHPTAGAMLDLLRHAWRVFPAVYDFIFEEALAGLRPAVSDHMPVIGRAEVDGLFVATGHFRHGILLAPATAHYLAEWMVTGVQPVQLAPFAFERLSQKRRAHVA